MFDKKIKKIIKIEGMHCDGCVNRVKNVLESMKEVVECEVSLENKQAMVVLKKDVGDSEFEEKIENLGFKVVGIRVY